MTSWDSSNSDVFFSTVRSMVIKPFKYFDTVFKLTECAQSSFVFMVFRKISVRVFLTRDSSWHSMRHCCYSHGEIIKLKYEAHGQLIQNVIIDTPIWLVLYSEAFLFVHAPQKPLLHKFKWHNDEKKVLVWKNIYFSVSTWKNQALILILCKNAEDRNERQFARAMFYMSNEFLCRLMILFWFLFYVLFCFALLKTKD